MTSIDPTVHLNSVCLGSVPDQLLQMNLEQVHVLRAQDVTLQAYYKATQNAFKLYSKAKTLASQESYKRSKTITSSSIGPHPVLAPFLDELQHNPEAALLEISNYRPKETIFEVVKRGKKLSEPQVFKKQRVFVEALKMKKSMAAPQPDFSFVSPF